MNSLRLASLSIVFALVGAPFMAHAHGRARSASCEQAQSAAIPQPFELPAAGTLQAAFSPYGGAEALVTSVIDSAHSDIRVLAYSFTSPAIVAALVRARHRGVDVRVVADEKENTSMDRSGKARAALSTLVDAGADVRIIDCYPIHHDKVIVADRETVELGSFNFSSAAEQKNSENVLVNRGNPRLAALYLQHFERNYRQSMPYVARY